MSEVVLDSADVKQGVHVVEPAPSSRLLELNGMRGLVLGQPEPVHGVVPAEFPPQPWVVSVDMTSGSHTRVGSCVHFRICVPQPVHLKLWQQTKCTLFAESMQRLSLSILKMRYLKVVRQSARYHCTE